MKRSLWSAYAIAAPSAPLLYAIIVLFFPEITNRDEFSAVTWAVSATFFIAVSYIACLIFGGALIFILRGTNKLRFWWVVMPGSILYAVALYLTLFVLMGGQIHGDTMYVISATLAAGFGLGIIVTTLFCLLAGITRSPNQRSEQGRLA
jgi:hypothetical protein